MQPETAYTDLLCRARERALLGSCANLLEWDEETCMPPSGVLARSEQRALLAGLIHERATDPRLAELLAAAQGFAPLAPLAPDTEPDSAAVNVRELARDFARATCLPRALVEETARTSALAQQAWAAARQGSDFSRFEPWLARMVALKREAAEALSAGSGNGHTGDLYDALLDEWEPGMTCRELEALFAALRRELVPLAAALAGAPRKPDASLLRRSFPVARQRAWGAETAAALGFDFTRGRLDDSVHPFCMGVAPGDCRLTARYQEGYFPDGLCGILHEAGHGLYEQGLDPQSFGTPMGEAASLGIHESQSRLWENLVGRSRPFWEHFYPAAREAFPVLADVALDDFHFAVNQVTPSLNRVQADEVTYNLHVLVRFDLERALLSGDLPVAELPGAWNRAYTEVLGITPQNDAEGCLQDVHWSAGMFGYFPTYTLGNVCASQLLDAAEAELPDLAADFRQGRFAPLLGWLRERVHRHGRRYRAAELLRQATGAPPQPGPFLARLRTKYGELYGL
jgi:carboxypeptidase Taq